MIKYIARRVLAIIPVCLGISVVVFGMIHLVPGDPAIALVGPNSNPETLAKVRQSLGLTAPVYVQYGRWLTHAVHGDLGLSIHMDQPVLPELLRRFRASLLLAAASFALAIPIGIGAGVVAALTRGSPLDRLTMVTTMVGISMPPFYIGMLLIIVFSVGLRWLPSGGMFEITQDPTPLSI